MIKTISALSKEEWRIYDYIKERTLKGLWTSQDELIYHLFENGIRMNKRTLRRHIQNIRRCDIIQKVVITSYTYGYKLMSEEDQFLILERRKNSILKSLKQYHRDVKRLSQDGQMKLTFNTKEREVIESLLKVENNE